MCSILHFQPFLLKLYPLGFHPLAPLWLLSDLQAPPRCQAVQALVSCPACVVGVRVGLQWRIYVHTKWLLQKILQLARNCCDHYAAQGKSLHGEKRLPVTSFTSCGRSLPVILQKGPWHHLFYGLCRCEHQFSLYSKITARGQFGVKELSQLLLKRS